jgi:hypothetical protein
MKKQDNGYYELAFKDESKPSSRILKFKTDMGEFGRYTK